MCLQKKLNIEHLISKDQKILVAISGGADSICLLDYLYKQGYSVAAAHCNFNLRGEDSDLDEYFVRDVIKKYNIELFVKSFQTEAFAKENKISIEMAARKLRYEWFEELSKENGFHKIATAHHSDDSVETILLNLAGKTGIKGLLGIPEKNGKLVRPLLKVAKTDILEYCNRNNLSFRDDKTNFETKYNRNKVRHLIIPEFEKINPAFSQNVLDSASNLKLYADFVDAHLRKFRKKCVVFQSDKTVLSIEKLKKNEHLKLFLYEFLSDYGFNYSQVLKIIISLDNQSGKMFLSDKYRLVKERKELVISKISKQEQQIYRIESQNDELIINKDNINEMRITCSFRYANEIDTLTDKKKGFFDFEKIEFPIIIRKWRKGDYFKPFGMNGKSKKVSDYFK
ncbi:MAG TPA: tRNA lysidine(34) synthetase TilS, partial [Bacteroidetes bacterium]|nr:tRNA lysidine(34) synthetase TilS [Bacteroidota bacterium]